MSRNGAREPVFEVVGRDNPLPALHSEPTFNFLNRVAGEYWEHVRRLVQGWADHLPLGDYLDVRNRLRSGDDGQFRSAFLELYLHESLLRAGYQVTIHPDLPHTNRHPDFFVTGPRGAFYLEAISPGSSAAAVKAGRRRAAFYDVLDRVKSPNFFLWIDDLHEGPRAAAVSRLKKELEQWLATLDPDGVWSYDDGPSYTWEGDEWRARFRPIPIRAEKRGIAADHRALGVYGGGEASFVNDAPTIRRALASKHSAYGELDHPFIVAVGLYIFDSDLWHAKNAFYGQEVIQFSMNNESEATATRQGDGYFGGRDGWRNQQVSAVLLVNQLMPYSPLSSTATLWKHPGAIRPLQSDPGFAAATLALSGHQLSVTPSLRSPADLFGLSEPWPPGEPFPR